MHGLNLIRKPEKHPEGHLQVHEMWQTIQGEGPYSGHPAIFVRLTGCNLRCWFCDTHWDNEKDIYYSPKDLTDIVRMYSNSGTFQLCVITGGEPLRQNLAPFIEACHEVLPELIFQIETAGTLFQPVLYNSYVKTVVSPKTPKLHPNINDVAMAYKYVIRHNEVNSVDGLPMCGTQIHNRDSGNNVKLVARPPVGFDGRPILPVYLSPMDEGDEHANALNRHMVLKSALENGYIAGLQMHKIFGVS